MFLQLIQSGANENYVYASTQNMCYYRMIVTLIEGLHYVDNFPSWDALCDHPDRLQYDFSLSLRAHNYMRCFWFKIFDEELEDEGLLCQLRLKKSLLRPMHMIGVSGNVNCFETPRTSHESAFVRYSTRVLSLST